MRFEAAVSVVDEVRSIDTLRFMAKTTPGFTKESAVRVGPWRFGLSSFQESSHRWLLTPSPSRNGECLPLPTHFPSALATRAIPCLCNRPQPVCLHAMCSLGLHRLSTVETTSSKRTPSFNLGRLPLRDVQLVLKKLDAQGARCPKASWTGRGLESMGADALSSSRPRADLGPG